jgi:hypothetical protein
VIIEGIVKILKTANKKKNIGMLLIDHAKEHYISLWLRHVREREENPDIDFETKEASNEFDTWDTKPLGQNP